MSPPSHNKYTTATFETSIFKQMVVLYDMLLEVRYMQDSILRYEEPDGPINALKHLTISGHASAPGDPSAPNNDNSHPVDFATSSFASIPRFLSSNQFVRPWRSHYRFKMSMEMHLTIAWSRCWPLAGLGVSHGLRVGHVGEWW